MDGGVDWFQAVDAYCERTGPEYWSEPLNAVTNAAFLAAALWVWGLTRGYGLARVLAVNLGVIGVGSWMFHTQATRIAGLADVLPIAAFILIYILAASRDLLGLRTGWAFAAAAAFLPYAAATVPIWSLLPGLGSSAGYMPVPVLILFYAWLLRYRNPEAARGFMLGAGLLLISIAFRSADGPFCAALPVGTHFIWHLLNAVMLAHMIRVLVRGRRDGLALRAGAGDEVGTGGSAA